MTGDCHVRFCERLRGETPLCLLGARKKSPQFCGASLRGGPAILWDRFVNEICLKFVGDSARLGFHPITSIHFGCRPLFGSRLLGEVVS
jgi:hypothetical protein